MLARDAHVARRNFVAGASTFLQPVDVCFIFGRVMSGQRLTSPPSYRASCSMDHGPSALSATGIWGRAMPPDWAEFSALTRELKTVLLAPMKSPGWPRESRRRTAAIARCGFIGYPRCLVAPSPRRRLHCPTLALAVVAVLVSLFCRARWPPRPSAAHAQLTSHRPHVSLPRPSRHDFLGCTYVSPERARKMPPPAKACSSIPPRLRREGSFAEPWLRVPPSPCSPYFVGLVFFTFCLPPPRPFAAFRQVPSAELVSHQVLPKPLLGG